MENTRIIAYCPLLYGKEYLSYAIKSVEPFVERIIILYTNEPSYGFGTDAICPETETELHDIAIAASPKVEWYKINAGTEGDHRNYILNFADGYDGILAFDADEIFDPIDLSIALDLCTKTDKRYIGFGGFINFWKSFNYACHDSFTPIRYINLHNSGGEGVVPCKVYHFSTAQSEAVMRYKLQVHGHKSEIRDGWLDMYLNWKPGDVVEGGLHLVAESLWSATHFDKNLLPKILHNHPNFNKEVIE
jgi:hypothetical protein